VWFALATASCAPTTVGSNETILYNVFR